jgi:hypothetical protein
MNPGIYGLSDYGSRLRSRAFPMLTYGQDNGFSILEVGTGSLSPDLLMEIMPQTRCRICRTNDRALFGRFLRPAVAYCDGYSVRAPHPRGDSTH